MGRMKKSVLMALVFMFSVFICTGLETRAATEGDFDYEILEDGTAMITAYNGYDSAVVVPGTVGDNIPVTVLGEMCFAGHGYQITSLEIPEGIKEFGFYCFDTCYSLESLKIPNSYGFDGLYFLSACGVKELLVNEDNPRFAEKDGIIYNKDYTVLVQCPPQKEGIVTIEDTTLSILDSAFYFCEKITEINIPAKTIKLDDFMNCVELKAINVDENNKIYASKEGVLYSKDFTRLLMCPVGKTDDIVLDERIETIEETAFGYCAWVAGEQHIYIPADVTFIFKNRLETYITFYCYEGYVADYFLSNYSDIDIEYHVFSALCDDECNLCGLKKTKYVADHALIDGPEKEATCTEAGEKSKICQNEGCTYTEVGEAIPALGHTWDEGKIITEPTTEAEGVKTFTCTVCNETKTEPIDKLDKPELIGWQKENGIWCYYNNDGTKKTDWLNDKSIWYYFDGNGSMVTGWKQIGGTWYYFSGSGSMVTGWKQIGGTWYYFNGSGATQTGWLNAGGIWYYFNGSGAMQTGWLNAGGIWYYFNGSGAMQTGWLNAGGIWYYFNGSGAMQTGWLKSGNAWYYMDVSGAMVTGKTVNVGGVYYTFDRNGVWIA